MVTKTQAGQESEAARVARELVEEQERATLLAEHARQVEVDKLSAAQAAQQASTEFAQASAKVEATKRARRNEVEARVYELANDQIAAYEAAATEAANEFKAAVLDTPFAHLVDRYVALAMAHRWTSDHAGAQRIVMPEFARSDGGYNPPPRITDEVVLSAITSSLQAVVDDRVRVLTSGLDAHKIEYSTGQRHDPTPPLIAPPVEPAA